MGCAWHAAIFHTSHCGGTFRATAAVRTMGQRTGAVEPLRPSSSSDAAERPSDRGSSDRRSSVSTAVDMNTISNDDLCLIP